MKQQKVEGHGNLVRDGNTGAVVSINKTEADQARSRKARWKAEQNEQEQLKSDVDQLKNDVSLIKDLLIKLVEK